MNEQVFKSLPDNSKVWIYQSNRELSDGEVNQLHSLIKEFIQQWTSHSRKVIADGVVIYNRFIVLAADESAFTVSGCSVDSLVGFIKRLEQQFNIHLFDRFSIAYRENGLIKTAAQSAFQHLVDNGDVTQDTMVFNNLVATVKDFRESWEIPISKSWHGKFFKVQVH